MFPNAWHLKTKNSTDAIIMLILSRSVLLFETLAVSHNLAYPVKQQHFLRKQVKVLNIFAYYSAQAC